MSGNLDCTLNQALISGLAWTNALAPIGATQLWSDPATWGGQVPRPGANVVIPAGQHIVLDIETPALGGVRVEGTLSFADKPVAMTADWILVSGPTARFEIGAEDAPYRHKATITLTADDPTENVAGTGIMSMGTKFLATMNGGSIAIHGHRRDAVSWTVLDAHVRPGDTEIVLARAVDWRPGDRIVVAPSGYSPFEAEMRTVANVSGNGKRVTLTEPLAYRHFGEVQTIEGRTIDMRAEVGLLTRDILIQGDAASTTRVDDYGYTTGFGGHIMLMSGGTAKIEGVELYRMGQTGGKGRYPIHWHLAGDREGDYARSNSIHHSFQRAAVVHNTQRVTIEDNVAYHVLDHMYVFSEEGEEYDNRFIGNLGVLNFAKKVRDFAFPRAQSERMSNQGEERSGIFWGRNPHNVLIGNRAAGSYMGHGFFYDQQHIQGFAGLRRYLHQDKPITFTGNVAHTIFDYPGGGSFDSYGPETRGSGLMIGFREGPYPLVFGPDFLAYKVSHSGVWIEEENETIVGATVADAGIGVTPFLGQIRDLFVVGNTANDIGGPIPATTRHLAGIGGVNITSQAQKKQGENDRRLRIDGATFVDLEPAGITVEWREFMLGSEVSGLEFIRTEPIFFFEKMQRGSIFDADGSLSGTGRPGSVHGEGDAAAQANGCDWRGSWSGWFCPDDGVLNAPTPALSVLDAEPGVAFDYWQDDFMQLPKVETLGAATGRGTARTFDLNALPAMSGHAVRFDGFLNVPTTGTYRFVLDAKEGGAVSINGETLIWGSRPGQPRPHEGYVRLEAGFHAIAVDHYKRLSNPQLRLSWSGPGFAMRPVREADLVRGTGTGGGPTDPPPPPPPGENQAPAVAITSPTDGGSVDAGRSVQLRADANDTDGVVTRVAFLVDGEVIGEDTSAPFSVRVRRAPQGTYTLTAVATDNEGATTTSSAVTVTVGSGVRTAQAGGASAWAIDEDDTLPTELAVGGFYPNPFNAATTARLDIADEGDYEVAIYDVTGRLVQSYALFDAQPGTVSVRLDLSSHASGVYVMQARHRETGRSVSAQMTLVR
ncbi:MAG: G8 domain-containing protein [Bacteroidota bacterium]